MSNTLQHSPADIVRWALINAGLGTDPMPGGAWPVFATSEPDLPDNCVTVYDTVGSDDGRVMVDGELQEHMGFQVRVRSQDHNGGYRKANALRVYLSEVAYQVTVTIDDVSYLVHCFAKIGDIFPLGKEVPLSRRSLFTLNAMLVVDQLTP